MEKVSDSQRSNPGTVLRKLFMDPLGISAYRLALDIQVPPISVSQILRGRRAISAGMALRLGRYFGVASDFWLSLQAAEDLRSAMGKLEGLGTVERCPALKDRAFLIREAVRNGERSYEVLIAAKQENTKAPTTTSRSNQGILNGGSKKRGTAAR